MLSKFSSSRLFYLFPLVILIGYYVPVLFFEFGYSDDFHALWQNRIGNDWTSTAAQNGRPIQGWIVEKLFSWAYSISGLSKIRLLAVILLCSINYLLYRSFKTLFRNDNFTASVFSLLPLLVPSFEIITVWPSTFPAIVSLLLSLISGYLFIYKSQTKALQFTYWALGCVFLFAALLTYQAPIAACLIPWLINSAKFDSIKHFIEKLTPPVLGFIATNVSYYFWFSSYQGNSVGGSQRTEVTSNIADKIVWFVEQPLKLSFATFATLETDGTRKLCIILQVVFILAGVLWFLKGKKVVHGLILFFSWVLAVPLAYYVGLIVAESWPSYRTQSVLSLVVIFFIATSLLALFTTTKRRIISVFILLIFLVFNGKHLYHDYVLLQQHDLNKINQNIETIVNDHSIRSILFDDTIHVMRPERIVGWKKGFIKQFGVDEFGIPSSAVGWSTEPMFRLILEDNYEIENRGNFKFYNLNDSLLFEKKDYKIDLDKNFDDF